jgi:hypothetical protein
LPYNTKIKKKSERGLNEVISMRTRTVQVGSDVYELRRFPISVMTDPDDKAVDTYWENWHILTIMKYD